MKVVEINVVCGYGSTGRITLDLYDLLTNNHHECYIAYGRGDAPRNINTINIGNKKNTLEHVALSRLTDKHGFYSTNATNRFLKLLDKIKPDIIHLHNIHGYYVNVEILFLYIKINNIKVIWTLHDCWAFTGHCAHFDYIGCTKWKTQCSACEQRNSYPKSFVDNSYENYEKKKKLFSNLNNLYIVTPSYWLANLVQKSFLNYASISTIHNGIDLEIFKPSISDIKKKLNIENRYMILCVSSIWTDKKGFQHIIEMSNMLSNNEVIVMIGVTKKQSQKLPVNIIGISRTDNIHELAEFYTASDVFINPTLEDNYPTVNLESLACGTPVITYPTGGSVESVVNKELGIICKDKTVISLLDAVQLIQKNTFDTKKIRNYAIKHFDKNKCYNDYLKLFETINNIK